MTSNLRTRSALMQKPDWRQAIMLAKVWGRNHMEFVVITMAFLAMTLAYVIVFQIARDEPLSISISAGLRNIGAIVPMAIFVRYCVRGTLRKQRWPLQIFAHVILACFVSLAWYTLVLFLRSWTLDWMQTGIAFTPFSQKASFWHLYQGLVVYAALVAASYAFMFRSDIQRLQKDVAHHTVRLSSGMAGLFVKSDDEFLRLEYGDVTHISANNESVIIHTLNARFRSNRKMKDMERELRPMGFVRVHRSYLINMAMVRSVEPAGDGRLSVHLQNGTSLISSRAGAKRFKDLVST